MFVTIVLSIVLAIGFFLLLTGEKFFKACIALVVGAGSFVGFLYLFDWAFTSTASFNTSFFVECWLPFVLAIVCALLVAILVCCLVDALESLAVFLVGAAAGAIGMLVIRNFIIASNSSLATDPYFFYYWIGLAVVALLCGIIAVCCRRLVFLIASTTVGSYLFASSIMGLCQAYVAGGISGWIFYAIFGPMVLVGVLVQVFIFNTLNLPPREGKVQQAQKAPTAKAGAPTKAYDVEAPRP